MVTAVASARLWRDDWGKWSWEVVSADGSRYIQTDYDHYMHAATEMLTYLARR